MEKEESKLEVQAEVEEQEAEEPTPLVRNSRNGDDSKIIPKYGVEINGGVSNGVSQNENENEELRIPAENQKMEEIDWVLANEVIDGGEESEKKVLENGAEAITEGKNSKENHVFHDKAEGLGVNPIPAYIHKTLIVEDPARTKHDVSSLVPVIQFSGASVINNQHGEEGKEDGFSNSDGLPSDSSSQEGVDSTYAYIIREPVLKGPAKYAISSLDPAIQLNGASVINNQHEEEDKEDGVSSSDALSSDSSSQEGVDSTSTYIIREQVLKGPAKYAVSPLDPVIQFNGASVINNQYDEEGKENGVSSSDVLPSESSSQEDLVADIDSTSTYIIREPVLKGPATDFVSSLDPVFQFNGASIINNQHEDKENGISSSDVLSSDSSSQEDLVLSLDPAVDSNGASVVSNQYEDIETNSISEKIHGSSKEIESEETELINEDDLEITELDVERVIRKQTTHDLYCPNCKSCITKRVILSKRKRRKKIPDGEVKRPKTDTAAVGTVSSEDQVHQEGEVGNDDAQTQPIDEDDRDRGPVIFRCLSCFSIFIPTGDGFRLFGRSGKENARDGQAPDVKKSWFDIFKPNRQKTLVGEGISFETNVQQVSSAIPSSSPARVSGQPLVLQDTAPPARAPAPAQLEGTTADEIQDLKLPLLVDELNAVLAADQQMESKPSREVQTIQGDDVVQLPQPSVSAGVDADGTLISVSIPHNEQEVRATIVTTSILDSINVDSRSSDSGNSFETNVKQVSLAIPSSSPAGVSGQPLVLQDSAPPARAPARLKGTTAETAAHEGQDLKIPLLDQQTEPKPIQEVQTIQDNDIVQLPQPSVNADSKLISVSIPHNEQDVRATIVPTSIHDNRNFDSSSDIGEVYPAEVPQKVTTTTTVDFRHDKPLRTSIISEIGDAPSSQGVGIDTKITIIDTHPGATITPSTVSQSGTQTSTAEREGLGAREERKVEVIKSVVYGGLAEIMTSLSIVSSAAGGGASTLNVLTLGAANLIGGLFIIAHNLWDLKCDRVEEQLSNQVTEQADRYRQLLGRRQNFALHAFVAIVAYITFGLVPPVVYGFSFRESDDKQLKLLMVAAASFVCILVLTLGKAYVQRPPKPYLKTVMTFLVIGISASGVSYAAGGLVERLLEKLGLFEPSSVAPNLLVPEMRPVGSGWASY
ncbi:membrane protein of ER body-like protein isoform X2 [Salvia splendens]|uniref:membrane protein of ER body-like protein isoform X2 n=1 Tax=Salvia splendens TaxID=180675 RepID=UPI001C26D94C|nr:membrane protein of ER body-like protein isoform X2 [Salvia splendens]